MIRGYFVFGGMIADFGSFNPGGKAASLSSKYTSIKQYGKAMNPLPSFLSVFAFALAFSAHADTPQYIDSATQTDRDGEIGGGEYVAPHDEISPDMRKSIMDMLDKSRAALEEKGILGKRGDASRHAPANRITNFAWPLKQASGRTDFTFYHISNFIDEDSAYPSRLLDYNCGTRTYDLASGYNHKGTDIALWPFPWKKMDNGDVEIIAGAAGTIISKTDGNFDRSCGLNSDQWNAVYIQHSDGSVAWYGHMKSGSTTGKAVGASVAAGEYLGTVGSSGSSTGPHLHLELYDSSNALVDPWLGSCNAKSQLVTWETQLPYYETAINAITVGPAVPEFPACSDVEVSNDTGYATPGSRAYFTVYARDQRSSDAISVKWYKPDGSLWDSVTSGVPSTYYGSAYWYWSRTLPTTPKGAWRVDASINGNSVSKTFLVATAPSAPTNLSATSLKLSAELRFDAATDNGGTVTGYTATCSAAGQTTQTASGSSSPLTVGNMASSVAYSCSVTATNAIGVSDASSSVSVTPGASTPSAPDAPTAVSATAGVNSAVVSFSAPANTGGSAITGYAATCSASGQATQTASGAGSPLTVGGMTSGIVYSCSVTATNATGTSAASGSASVTPTAAASAPDAPTAVVATAGVNSAVISFSAPANTGGSAITGYAATCSASGQTTRTASGTGSPLTVSGMTSGIVYSCSVTATNATGTSAASGSASVTPTAAASAPDAPTTVAATAGVNNAVISFSAPANTGGSAITGYAATCSASGQTTRTASGSGSPLTVSGMTSGIVYSCSVTATNATGTGAASSSASVTPGAVPTLPPDAPTMVGAVAGVESAVVSFSAPANPGSGAITAYTATCSAPNQTTQSATGSASPLTVQNLSAEISYSCSVSATNIFGTSAASSSASVTPSAPVQVPVCTLTASSSSVASGKSVTLTASCTPAASSYTWTNSGFADTAAFGVIKPFFTNTYSVQGNDANGSGAKASVTVTVTDTLIISAPRANYTLVADGKGFILTDDVGSGGSKTLNGIKRIKFSNASIALDIDDIGGQAYRLYQAAFGRVPDLPGLGFQMWAMEVHGSTLTQVAQNFMDSPEFISTYGANTTDEEFITLFYSTVLKRPPEQAGLNFYLDGMKAGDPRFTRDKILTYFSESTENKSLVLPAIQNGFEYVSTGGN